MKTVLAAAFAVACLAPGALADSVTFAPGLWAYDGQALFGMATLTDSGEECMAEGENSYDLNEAASSIADGCALTSARPVENGYEFTLACTGSVKGELAGTITVESGRAELTARGWTGAPETPLNVSVSARATRLADTC